MLANGGCQAPVGPSSSSSAEGTGDGSEDTSGSGSGGDDADTAVDESAMDDADADESTDATADTESAGTDEGDDDGEGVEGHSLRVVLNPPTDATLTVGEVEHPFVNGQLLLDGLETDFLGLVKAPGFAPYLVCLELGGEVVPTHTVELTALAAPVELTDAAVGGSVSFEGISVTIPAPDSFVDGEGEPVTGPIDITMTQLDLLGNPSASPTCFTGQTAGEQDVLLTSFGMLDISAWTKEGDELQLAEGKSAEITMPVPPLLAESTETVEIPLWWMDEEAGWKEEGLGALTQAGEDSSYTFSVEHFSWYNADIASNGDEFECYTIVVRDDEGELTYIDFYTVALANGFFVDGGWSSVSTEANEGFNCVIAPINSTPELYSDQLPGVVVLSEGTGEHGLCTESGVPNPNCALVEIELPDPNLLPNGDSCVSDDECQSGVCYDLPPCLGGPRCGECDEDADCANGGCTPPNPFIPPGNGAGSTCNLGQLGGGCETDAACNVMGSTCTTVFSPGGLDMRTCGLCDNVNNDCLMGEVCHPAFDIPGFTGWNSCLPFQSLPTDSYCAPLPSVSGILACESNNCGEVMTACGTIGICGECMSDAGCGPGLTCNPGQLGFPEPVGSTCI